jgi:hypothetical protein
MPSAVETGVRSSMATFIGRVVSLLHHDGEDQRCLFFVPLRGRLVTHFSWRNGAAPTRRSTGQHTIANDQRLSRNWLVAG